MGWLSYGISPLANKPVQVMGASYGRLGTLRAQKHLRAALHNKDIQARVMPANDYYLSGSMNAFDDEGNLTSEDEVKKLEQVFSNFIEFIDLSKDLDKRTVEIDFSDNFRWE